MDNPPILFASDHRGYELKFKLILWAAEQSYAAKDLGPDSDERCDAGDFATRLATELMSKPGQFGVLICGTGQAMAMTANRYRGIRAALCCNASVARLSRQHNDANVLVLGADITGEAVAVDCLETFLTTEMLGGRYAQRRDKLEALGGI
jgi:ribose 5-phosphate isomerase B